jgi:hypothetical protein
VAAEGHIAAHAEVNVNGIVVMEVGREAAIP